MHKRNLTRFIALVLAALTAFSLTLPAFAAAEDYDFTYKGSDKTDTFKSENILEEHLGEALSEAEKSFLESYSTLALKYNPVINANRVSVKFESGELTITAEEYSYTAENGRKLVWTPETAIACGTEKPFEKTSDGYVANFVTDTECDAEVIYKSEVEISQNDFDLILNLHYSTAEYALHMADYEKKQALYEEYLYKKRLYDDALAEYNRYLDDYAEYEELKYRFEHYDELMAQYALDKAKYDEYLELLRTYDAEIKRYEEYESKLKKVKKQLSAFELLYLDMKDGRSIYTAVMGGAVDQVLASEGAIISELGKQYKDIVDLADKSTRALRSLMTSYMDCETEEEKYNFYVANYEKICESVFGLTQSLDELYYAPGVKAGMKAFEKHEKYIILVAELVITSNALIDGEVSSEKKVYDEKWKIDKRDCNTIFENNSYFEDGDSALPLLFGYPAEVAKPNIEVVENPTLPVRPSSRPIAPLEVANPGEAPTEVAKPSAPETVSAVSDIYNKLDGEMKKELVDLMLDGKIKQRMPAEAQKNVILKTKVYKTWNCETVDLKFEYYDSNGELTTYTLTTDKNTPVVYDSAIPETVTDKNGIRAFDGWILKSTGKRAVLSDGFSEDTILIANYKNITPYFDVIWRFGDSAVTESHPWGSIPEPGFIPAVPDDGDYYFEFAGWDRELEILTSSTTYTAVFDKKFIVPIEDGGASLTVDNHTLVCDSSKYAVKEIDVSNLIARVDGKYALKLITSVGTLAFTFTDTLKLVKLGVAKIEIDSFSNGISAFESCIRLYGKDGNEIQDSEISADISIRHELSDLSDVVLKSEDEYVKFKSDPIYVSYRAKPGNTYILIKEYSVFVVKNELVELKVDKTTAYMEDVVRLDITKKPGVEIVSVSVTDRKGNPIEFDRQNNAITITDSDIVVSVTAKYTVFDIVFVSNGVIVSHQELTYGAMPKLPSDPTMLSDEEYTYKFSGWSPEVTAVTEDTVYEARFEKQELHPEDEETPKRDNFLKRVFKTVFIYVYSFMRDIRTFFEELFS